MHRVTDWSPFAWDSPGCRTDIHASWDPPQSSTNQDGWSPRVDHILPLRFHLNFWQHFQVQKILSSKLLRNSGGFWNPTVDFCKTVFTEPGLQLIIFHVVTLKILKNPKPWLSMGTKSLIMIFAPDCDPGCMGNALRSSPLTSGHPCNVLIILPILRLW